VSLYSPNMSTLKIPTAEIFEPLLAPARYKAIFGGRGSGKSHFFGELLIELCEAERGISAVCIRESQKTLAQSSKRLIESKIEKLGLSHRFKVYSDRIATPGDGLIIFRGMQDHTAEAIKSLEGFRIAWVDEAQTLSARSLALLRPTIRAPGSELWASWNPYNVPLLGGMDFWDTVAPNSSFIFPQGQAISRTTYAAAFARWGTQFGAGDGSTTFNVPDKTGRVSAMIEATAGGSRLTAAGGGVVGSTLGSAGGTQTKTLSTQNLPPYTPAGTITNGAINASQTIAALESSEPYAIQGGNPFAMLASSAVTLSQSASTFAGTAQGGTSAPINGLPPLIVCNYIIRVF
jgi:microcystin-dependent protein